MSFLAPRGLFYLRLVRTITTPLGGVLIAANKRAAPCTTCTA